jgi:GNAT superfamily N-acetyltransferase
MAGRIAEELVVVTLAQRPDLRAKVFGPDIQSALPEFMRHDPAADLYYGSGNLDRYLEFGLAAFRPADPSQPVARAFCVPFAFRDGTPEREELPDGGWDEVIRWGHEDQLAGRQPNSVSALEIMVAPHLQGEGVARVMLTAMRDNARRLGFRELYAPLRLTDKHNEPSTPFAEYAARRRTDGLPFDSWLRTHIRAGADIVKLAPCAMTIPGTLAEWRNWTGLPFAKSGPTIVPGALSPIHVSLEQDHAVYVEPGIWVRHPLS